MDCWGKMVSFRQTPQNWPRLFPPCGPRPRAQPNPRPAAIFVDEFAAGNNGFVSTNASAPTLRLTRATWAFWSADARAAARIASVDFGEGAKTASGERVRGSDFTGARRTLPFGTRVRVINKRNGRSIIVCINDRGPFVRGRVIDRTTAAARALGFAGLASVNLKIVRFLFMLTDVSENICASEIERGGSPGMYALILVIAILSPATGAVTPVGVTSQSIGTFVTLDQCKAAAMKPLVGAQFQI
jgi:rare lipoprotein A